MDMTSGIVIAHVTLCSQQSAIISCLLQCIGWSASSCSAGS